MPRVVNMAEKEKSFADEINKALAKSEGLPLKELLFRYQGTPYPVTVCSAETFQALEDLEARGDDLVLASYPKCGVRTGAGFHWADTPLGGGGAGQCRMQHFSGISHMIEKLTGNIGRRNFSLRDVQGSESALLLHFCGSGVNWLIQIVSDLIFTSTQSKCVSTELPFIECGDPDKYQRMKQIPSPRILATHLSYDCLPKSIFGKKAKILVLFRNPKDTAVSFFHFHNNVPSIPSYSSWDEFFSEFMNGKVSWGSYFDQAVTWNKHIEDENIMVVLYEDLKENLMSNVKQIAQFLGFSSTAEQIQSIADRATFQAVKDKSQETHGPVGSFLFRKGIVGDWKNLFTEAQNEEMDAKFKMCLGGTKLGAMLKYDVYCKV